MGSPGLLFAWTVGAFAVKTHRTAPVLAFIPLTVASFQPVTRMVPFGERTGATVENLPEGEVMLHTTSKPRSLTRDRPEEEEAT